MLASKINQIKLTFILRDILKTNEPSPIILLSSKLRFPQN